MNKEQKPEQYVYEVEYHAGTHSGKRFVIAFDEEEAIAKIRAWVREEMILPMYSQSYKIVLQSTVVP